MNNIDTSISHITTESDNIFEDLGFKPMEAKKLKIKAQLMCQISKWIKNKSLNHEKISKLEILGAVVGMAMVVGITILVAPILPVSGAASVAGATVIFGGRSMLIGFTIVIAGVILGGYGVYRLVKWFKN